ncbi:MAG TPA: hypothetical protein VLE47_04750 [Candidatus Saccharimonadales bacterium]|nr:hypothetical protein [Candidatus Saccharimonadales bacterium]
MLKVYLRTAALLVTVLVVMAGSPTISKNQTSEADTVPQISQNPQPQTAMVVSVVAQKDNRVERLEKYFRANASPFSGKAQNFIDVADKYDLDWTLLPSIANLESQLGKAVPAYSYNPYGWNNGSYHFASWEQANEIVANGLRTRYAPTGVITPWRIGRSYAASPTWAIRVAGYQQIILSVQ